jgi:hypothetical protein
MVVVVVVVEVGVEVVDVVVEVDVVKVDVVKVDAGCSSAVAAAVQPTITTTQSMATMVEREDNGGISVKPDGRYPGSV